MAGKHTEKLTLLVENLSRQNADQHRHMLDILLNLAVYQALAGPVPTDVLMDVTEELNKAKDPPATANAFLSMARAIAVSKLQQAQQEKEEAPEPTILAGPHSPYRSADDDTTTLPHERGTDDRSRLDTAPQLIVPGAWWPKT